MSLISRNNDILRTTTLLWQSKRFRGKINIQRPRAPHFVKAKFLELTKPYFPKINPELVNVCNLKNEKTKKEIDNPFQRIIAGELRDSFFNSKLIGFFHKNSISAERIFIATNLFKKNGMILKTYGKTTLEMAVSGTQFDTVLQFYCSQNMIMLSPEPDIKKMFTIAKKFPELIFLAGIYEGRLLNKDDMLYYQQIPNLQVAQVGLVQTLNSIGNQIVSHLNSSPNHLVAQLQQRMKQLEEQNK